MFRRSTALILIVFLFGAFEIESATSLLCEEGPIKSVLCVEFKSAIDSRADNEAVKGKVEALGINSLDQTVLHQAELAYREGINFFDQEYFGDADVKFRSSTKIYTQMLDQFKSLRQAKLNEARGLLMDKKFVSSLEIYELVESWESSSESVEGIEASKLGIKELSILDRVDVLLDESKTSEALNLLQGISPRFFKEERERRATKANQIKSDLLRDQNLSLGYRALDDNDLLEAKESFETALRTDPNSSAAKDGLKEATRRIKTLRVTELRNRLELAKELEDWILAKEAAESLISLDTSFLSGEASVSRFETLINFESELDYHLSNPDRFSSKNVRNQINNLSKKYVELLVDGGLGVRISDKYRQLASSFKQTTEKQEVALFSDNKTFVKIIPGQQLGQFKELKIKIIPGRYRLSGRRPGYKEVVNNIVIEPNGGPYEITVISSEKF